MKVNSFSQERETIEGYIQNNFDSFDCPIKFDNVDFFLKGGQAVEDSSTLETWARFSIQNDDSQNTVIGNKRTRIFGAVQASIYVREKQGTSRLRTIADDVYDLLANRTIDGVTFQAPVLTPLPPADGWYQHVVTVDYYWDRCVD